MLTLHTKLDHADTIDDTLVLDYDRREKCRLRVRLASGIESALFMVRAPVRRKGPLPTDPDNKLVPMVSPLNPPYLIRCFDALPLMPCASPLATRHTPIAIHPGLLRIRADKVL